MNENYIHPDMPEGGEEGIVRGLYRLSTASVSKGPQVQLLGAGRILRGNRGRPAGVAGAGFSGLLQTYGVSPA